ncbi:hypothetical protein CTEST_08005 [Corynebacterium testudinoris]|uniref:Uncharacterized protein n=1 Tax=Corynebacterium testudinoris TaxID=136857 RepID=A0A0G3H6K4_9CORY|nr:hypothetical protein [Corynebacterium testudinoris]AKK09031.1 hypothetical protein CTEST_08005 [Corynebacterium testudinoris]
MRRTAEISLTITGAADADNITIIDASPVTVDNYYSGFQQPGKLRDHAIRRLVDLPVVGFPTRQHIRVPRFTFTKESCPIIRAEQLL